MPKNKVEAAAKGRRNTFIAVTEEASIQAVYCLLKDEYEKWTQLDGISTQQALEFASNELDTALMDEDEVLGCLDVLAARGAILGDRESRDWLPVMYLDRELNPEGSHAPHSDAEVES
jgi:hypothetical protein